MSREVFYKIIDEIKAYNGVDTGVLYHGGEPFLNKNIFEMISVLKSMGVTFVKTVTNGTLLSDKMLARIVDSGLDSIGFSIDGLNPKENNRIRKGCDYFQVVQTIKKLLSLKRGRKSRRPEVHIANVQIPKEEDIRLGKKVSTPKYILDGFPEFEGEIKFKNTYMLKWPGFDLSNQYKLVEPDTRGDSLSPNYCDDVVEIITFRWNGDVVPCCYDITSEYVIGNIMEQSLAEIWNNEKYREIRRCIHLRRYMSLCIDCPKIRPQAFVAKIKTKRGR